MNSSQNSKKLRRNPFPLVTEIGKLKNTTELPEVCEKGDKISVKLLCEGRCGEMIGVVETRQGRRLSLY